MKTKTKKLKKLANGRPSIFSEKLADTICERLAKGESLRCICSEASMPDKSTVLRWLAEGKNEVRGEKFQDHYERARELQAENYAEEIIEIADYGRNDTYSDKKGNRQTNHDVIARSRLRVDSRKWIVSKLLPKKYGDFSRSEITGKDGKDLIPDKILRDDIK